MNKIKKPELIAPAGDLEKEKIAFLYGADAVYASTPKYSMRTREVGFSDKTVKDGIEYAHKLGKKFYLTINTFPHPTEINDLSKHIRKTIGLKPDAIIVADPGVLKFIKNHTNIPVHLSTQANTTNQLAANFWQDAGAERIVLARELSLKEIKVLSRNTKVEIECFVHGAMCMAYSGRCQISNYMTGRDSNKGACIQACRFKYKLYEIEEELRGSERYQIYEDNKGSYILNSKDLCMIEYIPELINAGISSFKLEGRLKSLYYVACATRAYRQAIDLYFSDPKSYKKNRKKFKKELEKVSNRGYTTGFYFGKPDSETNNYNSSKATSEWSFVGIIRKYDKSTSMANVEVKNYLPKGSTLEIVTPDRVIKYKLNKIIQKEEELVVAHANYEIKIPLEEEVPENSFIRMKIKNAAASLPQHRPQ